MAQRELTSELRHRQQQKKATTTILVVLLMLFFAFWYAFSYYRASDADGTPVGSTTTCRPYDPKVPVPGNTTVNVLNATTKSGLAARTAAELRRRGFKVGEIGNDSSGRKIAAAEVRFGPSGKGHAALVVPLGGKGTKQVPDKRKDATVDLVLGGSFTALAAAPKATGTPMCPAPTGSPSTSAS